MDAIGEWSRLRVGTLYRNSRAVDGWSTRGEVILHKESVKE